MRFSEAWLRDWANPPLDAQTLADQFSMAGLEVDALEPVAPAFQGVVVGEVLVKEPHPDADKLSLCQVSVGAAGPLQIVCGAKNVAQGQRVAVAQVGAVLPGDFKIKRAKLRGVESLGMICSASELGLADSSEGIMVLSQDAPLGQDIRDYLQLDDRIFDLDLTPDRGDCLSILGLAREVAALNRLDFAPKMAESLPAVHDDRMAVEVLAPEACPRYACRVIKNLNPAAETPLWMKERLRRSGINSLGPLVDVTNYVLLELGQPMHAFDLSCIQGGVCVRMANDAETLILLDGRDIRLSSDHLVIADHEKPLALAGIMGGEASGVSSETKDILLESAYFTPLQIAGKARALGLHTDSSHRFERGVAPTLQVQAIERATALLQEIAGGEPGPVVDYQVGEPAARSPIALRRERIGRLLGISIDDGEVIDTLQRLGMQLTADGQGWQVIPPACRFDVHIEADLIEEIGRLYGYDRIPTTLPRLGMSVPMQPSGQFDLNAAKRRLTALGYQEVISYSFVGPEWSGLLTPEVAPVLLANPISADMSVMRTSLWPGLLQAAKHNMARQRTRLRLFESGLQFCQQGETIEQPSMLAALLTGEVLPEQWGQPVRRVDFFDLKADVEAILSLQTPHSVFRFEAAEHPALHPGQSARILRDGKPLGWLGMLHPEKAKVLDVAQDVYLLELNLQAISAERLPGFAPLSKYPAIRRDIAILVDKDLSFAAVENCIRSEGGEFLKDILLFDVYTGGRVDSGRKSFALGLILQDSSRTLTDQEVDAYLTAVVERLARELGARLRD